MMSHFYVMFCRAIDGVKVIVNGAQIEKMFNRSWEFSFSKKKWLFFSPLLLLCGLLTVICRAISYGSGEWFQINLAFLPLFLCAGGICVGGIVLCRIYYHEVREEHVHYHNLIRQTIPLFAHAAYLTVPLIMSYLIFWILLGLFYLLREIPLIGSYMGAIFSFAPFLLLLAFVILGVMNLCALFYLTAPFAFRRENALHLAERGWIRFKQNPFLSIGMLLMGLFPTVIVVGILCLAVFLTHKMYFDGGDPLGSTLLLVLKWFFMMIPFVALLTPAVVFFFNFSVETYMILSRKEGQ